MERGNRQWREATDNGERQQTMGRGNRQWGEATVKATDDQGKTSVNQHRTRERQHGMGKGNREQGEATYT